MNNKLNVCVMFGGKSTEHDISIISGLQVYNALNKDKYNVSIIYISKDNKMYIGNKLNTIETYKNNINYKYLKEVSLLNENNQTYIKHKNKTKIVDIFIPVFHGEGTEDGTISALLEFIGATYITSDITSSSIAQDKIFTKDILKKYHIQTPRYVTINKGLVDYKQISEKLRYPLIIKPARLGSSIGIEKALNEEELIEKIDKVFLYSNRLIIEELIDNINEYNCACFRYNNKLYTSLVEEVKTNNDFLTFSDKYISENKKLKENESRIIPASISKELEDRIKEVTKDIYQILGFSGVIRIDYIYDKTKQKLFFNEVNTIPGSYAFYLYEKNNLSFDIMLDMLIKETIINKEKQKKLIKVFDSNILQNKSIKLNK